METARKPVVSIWKLSAFYNSHKASLYLAAGFPVVVWKESALAHFILEKNAVWQLLLL